MNRRLILAISVAGGLLTGFAWTAWGSGLILLFSFVPALYIEDFFYTNKDRFHRNSVFVFLIPFFIIFNTIALGWVHVVSIAATLSIILISTFCMTFIIWLAHIVRLKAGNFFGITAFIVFWLSLEYINLNFDLLHPWLNLGNGLSEDITLIQWYDITGTGGGTLWILLSNILITILVVRKNGGRKKKLLVTSILLFIIIFPVCVSLIKFRQYGKNNNTETEVIIIQPNIDPYSEKFTILFTEQLESVLKMAEENITDNTKWVLAPETTIDDQINESDFINNEYIIRIKEFITLHPGVSMIIGATTFRPDPASFPELQMHPETAGRPEFSKEIYNSALMIDTSSQIDVYHKSKLVPGFEKQLNGYFGKIISKVIPYLGGTQSGYGIQKERTPFEHSGTRQKVAPIICFESVFGEFVSKYVQNGAEYLFIMTNDGWWKNTNGYMKHLSYASLRAIENRRSVARAANTGISCLIDARGVIISSSDWWEPAVIKGNISSNMSLTPYVRYGDYILRAGVLSGILLFILVFLVIPLQKRFKL